MDLYSRVSEMMMQDQNRRPMTPDEMYRAYVGSWVPQPSRMSRLGANVAKTVQALAQRFHGGMPAPAAEPAYRRA
jgi:hypothetical protein